MTRSISPSCWCWLLRWISTARRARRPGSQSSSMIARWCCAAAGGSSSRSATVPADDAERWRVFLAIEVPDAVRAALTGPLGSLEPLREIVRVNAVERIQLTLHFLGHVPRADVEQLPATLAAIVGRHPRLRLAPEWTGALHDGGDVRSTIGPLRCAHSSAWIEHRATDPGAGVQILLGALFPRDAANPRL